MDSRASSKEWWMCLGFVLGAATAVLFVAGQTVLGVIAAILAGLAWTMHGITGDPKTFEPEPDGR